MKRLRWLAEKTGGYFYVGSPYSKYPGGIQKAWEDICAITSKLAEQRIPSYSPIAHTHALCMQNQTLDPFDHGLWMPFDTPLMRAAIGIVVVKMTGWEDSYGVKLEIDEFTKAGKPIFYLRPETMEVE